MSKELLTLSQKIARISKQAKPIPRNGVGYDGERAFTYTKAEDVDRVMQPLLERYKLLLTGQLGKDPMCNVLKGGVLSTEVQMDWLLTDMEADNFYSITYRYPGAAIGTGGVSAAITISKKNFLIHTFNLKVKDDETEQKPCPDSRNVTNSKPAKEDS